MMVIKNQDVERLLAELVEMTGETEAEAVRKALAERRERLAQRAGDSRKEARLRTFLQTEVWPQVPEHLLGRHLSRQEEEAILGFGSEGERNSN